MTNSTLALPGARRLMESLRDLGYSLPAAIADLVDNSIDAGAGSIEVTLQFDGDRSWVRVADDGCGMSSAEIDEAMRYGSRPAYGAGAQGKYGLGLKTASLSQCRTLTVATRTSPAHRRIRLRRWSLDHVIETDAWELLTPSRTEVAPETLSPLQDRPGTVVTWHQLDRLLRYRRPNGGAAESGFASLAREVAQHLSMVFHRFLSGESRFGRKIHILVNGDTLAPWDPFARMEPNTRPLPRQSLTIETANGSRAVAVRPYVLPREDRFSTRAAHTLAGGPNRWNRQQGLYIYRADRIIQSGGWNRIRAEDEHTKLARIAVDIPPDAEELFHVNVAKMRVTLPVGLRPMLRAMVAGVAATAQEAYRGTTPRTRKATSRADLHPAPDDFADTGAEVYSLPSNSKFDRRLGLYWSELEPVLSSELGDQPELLSRVLRALSKVSTYNGSAGGAPRDDVVAVARPN